MIKGLKMTEEEVKCFLRDFNKDINRNYIKFRKNIGQPINYLSEK